MGARVSLFERELEAYLGVPCAVMVNSGSSANLLAVAGTLELSGMGKLGGGVAGLRRGDEVLVPALAWSTTLAPLVQLGARPVLVDIKSRTLNMDVEAAARKITNQTRAIMLVHAMGNSPDMDALLLLAAKHRLVVIEDTCESLGSRHRGTLLGTQGHFGTFSFYYSHHITSGEGGAVVSSIRDDGTVCQTLRSLRAHGWTREFSPGMWCLHLPPMRTLLPPLSHSICLCGTHPPHPPQSARPPWKRSTVTLTLGSSLFIGASTCGQWRCKRP
jgi:CDP-6-deoxy-D-xylo-4-hexulose-3-dehydrase